LLWSLSYLVVRCVMQLVFLRPRSEEFKELEIPRPPAKIVGRYLAPFLADRIGLGDISPPRGEGAVPVDVVVEAGR
jgi:hypothetical protein